MAEQAIGHVCPPSVTRWLNSGLRKLVQSPRRIFGPHVEPGDHAVDLGCGGGFFSAGLAELVGERGRVTAVDLQPEMLEITKRYAERQGVRDRVTLHHCTENDLGLLGEQADFVVAFYMVHEVPDRARLLRQVRNLLDPGARFMMVEPSFHVKKAQFEAMLGEAEAAGLKVVQPVKLLFSRGMLFEVG